MANWAIVVGINEYWSPEANLKHAVSDALKMTAWLTNANGGNVPPRNLFLLTHPRLPADVQLSPDIQQSGANKSDLIDVSFALINQSRGKGDRLFVYFSGHGLTSRKEISPKQAVVMADFSPQRTDNSLTLSSLWEFFQGAQFPEQFFFIDACRNQLDWNFPYRLGDFPQGGNPVQPTPSQFLLYATAPEQKAKESGEGGAFTGVLLEGLKGAGKAKFFNSAAREYQVPIDRLLKYVRDEILKKKIVVSDPSVDPPIYQKPSITIPNSDGEFPFLAHFENLPDEELEIYVEPDDCWAQTTITVSNEIGQNIANIKPVTETPIKSVKKLPPMTYTIRAEASPLFEPEQPYWSFDLYEPTRSEVKMRQLEFIENTVRGTSVKGENKPIEKSFNGGNEESEAKLSVKKIKSGNKTARLTVESKDPLAPIEIADNNGVLQAAGSGKLLLLNLTPGLYRARLVTPEGRISEQVVNLNADEAQTVKLDAPPPPETSLFDEIIEKTNFAVREDNTISVAESVGRMATAQLTTMIILAASAIQGKTHWAAKTSKLGLEPFRRTAAGGLRIVFADELSSDEQTGNYLSQIKLGLRKQKETANEKVFHLKSLAEFNRIAQFSRETEPDAYFLSITLPECRPAIFSIAVLPKRLTLFVIHQRADASLNILGFSSSFQFEEPPPETAKNLRRLELLQRFYQSRCIGGHAYRDADELLRAKWLDPFAGCLGGYTMLNLNKAEELKVASKNMVKHYDNLSDSHILKAEYLLSQNSEVQAVESYKDALSRGVPMFVEGLKILNQAVRKYEIVHPQTALIKEIFENHVQELLWTAWTPKENLG